LTIIVVVILLFMPMQRERENDDLFIVHHIFPLSLRAAGNTL
jgi:hypothetical protein